ncbi:MAG: hypothetical protein ACOX0T_08405 [Pelotomaculum sp.]
MNVGTVHHFARFLIALQPHSEIREYIIPTTPPISTKPGFSTRQFFHITVSFTHHPLASTSTTKQEKWHSRIPAAMPVLFRDNKSLRRTFKAGLLFPLTEET